jgi:hypothetical protein
VIRFLVVASIFVSPKGGTANGAPNRRTARNRGFRSSRRRRPRDSPARPVGSRLYVVPSVISNTSTEVSTAIARPSLLTSVLRLQSNLRLATSVFEPVSTRPSVKPALEPRLRHFASMKAILDNSRTATTFQSHSRPAISVAPCGARDVLPRSSSRPFLRAAPIEVHGGLYE